MSSLASYNRRPAISNVGYYPNNYQDQYSNYNTSDYGYNRDYDRGRSYRGQNYNYNNSYGNNYNTYDRDYYEDDHTRSYGPQRRNSYNGQYYPESPATYSNVIPSSGRQYVDGGGQYATRSSRRKPIIIPGNGSAYTARPAVKYLNASSSTSSGYRAQGERGEPIPISVGLDHVTIDTVAYF